MTQHSPCRYFPCRCFSLGSGISCQVFNGLYQVNGQFRIPPSQANPSNKICAAKQINADHAATKYAQIEIDILKSLQHTNVVALLEVMPLPNGKIALCMERCDGNLDQLVKKPEHFWGLTTPLIFSLVTQYTAGFRYLYEKGVCHRDIKPLNILYNINTSSATVFGRRDDYIFKLADFGVAKKTGQEQGDVLKSLVGTPEFLCPEVIRGRYGPTADLWSAAVMIYFCIAGHLPFIGRDFHNQFAKYLMLLASSRKYEDIAAYCSSSDLSQVEFSTTLPVYCQLFHRLKKVYERLLRLMLSSALGHSPTSGNTGDSLGTLNPNAMSSESSKKIFEKFFDYVNAITDHCWFHVFDVSTFTINVAHLSPKTFEKSDQELELAIEDAVAKALEGGRTLQIIGVGNVENFRGRLVFEGGLIAFRSRFLTGTLTDVQKTMLVCSSLDATNSVLSSAQGNPIKAGFDSLMSELFIKREIDVSRLPKVTSHYFERCIFSVQSGIFPAVSSYRMAVHSRIDAAKKLLSFTGLPDMLTAAFKDQLNDAAQLLRSLDNGKMTESLRIMSSCQQQAQALSLQCEVYASISPVASTAGPCQYVHDTRHKELTQLVLSATNNGRAEINRQRMKIAHEFLHAADILLPETFRTFATLSKVVDMVDGMEKEVSNLCLSSRVAFEQQQQQASINIGRPQETLTPQGAAAPSIGATSSIVSPSSSEASMLSTKLNNIEASLGQINTNPQVKQSLSLLLSNLNALQLAVANKH